MSEEQKPQEVITITLGDEAPFVTIDTTLSVPELNLVLDAVKKELVEGNLETGASE